MKRKLFSLLLILCMMLTLFPTGALAAVPGTYNTSDIAAINAIIDAHPGKTGMTKANPDGSESPDDWTGVHWSEEASNKRVIKLYLNGKGMSGTLDVSGLTALQALNCYNNELTEVKLSAAAPYTSIDVRHNFLQSSSSVTGKEGIVWDDNSFSIDPQYRHITYDANGGTGTMTPGKALQAAPFTFPENEFSPPTGNVFRAWAVGSPGGTQKAPGAVDTFMDDTRVYAVWEKATTYNPGDIAAINAIIANNHPTGITKADPADGSVVPPDWVGVHWSDDTPTNKRVIKLSLKDRSMTGTLDVSSLTALQVLNCYNNGLTAIKLCGEANYTAFDVRLNYMTDTSAVTGKDGIVWGDEFNFNSFSPQYRWITFDANGGTGDMAPEKRAEGSYYHLPENGFTAPPKRPFLGWAIGSPSGPFMVTGGAYPVSTDITIYAVWDVIHVTGVKLNKNTLAIGLGDSETLVATVSPEDATNKSLTWESEDPTVATVDENGKVTALALGTTKIKATSNDNNDYWDECEVSVVKKQTMKFSPSGGSWKDGSTDPLIISAIAGAEITIPEGPIRAGYNFQYWKGSKYKPGDKFKVSEGGHEFTAVWAKASSPVANFKTGDNMGVYLWSGLALLSVGGLILVQRKKKTEQKD